MSITAVRACIERLKTDEGFAEKIRACKDVGARIALAKAEGFDFTADEFRAEYSLLSNDELESVSGGVGGCVWYPEAG